MIRIYREGSKVAIDIDANVESLGMRTFKFETYWGHETAAALVAEKLRAELGNQIQLCRRAEYESGWKDAKSKRRSKQNWFMSMITRMPS